MRNFDPMSSFGPEEADRYDDYPLRGDEQETVDCLERLACGGRVLELAIGTGRIAVPLTERGVVVDGIEQSEAMVARLRQKPAGAGLDVTIGDMSTATTGRTYPLVYLVFNTIHNLLTQQDQVRCFENVARHLEPGGAFLVEAQLASEVDDLPHHQYVRAESLEKDQVTLDVARYDPVSQLLEECHLTMGAGGIRVDPILTRYIWPSEMDLMARIAGLRLRSRWGGWNGEPFSARSTRHISVYERAPDAGRG